MEVKICLMSSVAKIAVNHAIHEGLLCGEWDHIGYDQKPCSSSAIVEVQVELESSELS